MRLIHYLVDRFLFAVGLIAGSQIPAFINQYRQHLAGRVAQLNDDLLLFQRIADRYFEGNMQALIVHHLSAQDTAFQAEGAALKTMLAQQQTLLNVYQQLQTQALPKQILVLLKNWDHGIVADTWQNFQPAIIGSTDAIILMVAAGFLFATLYQLIVRLISIAVRKLVRSISSSRA